MNMWLVVVIYCALWFTIMVVIYCEKMGSVWFIYVMVDYIWNACVDGMQKTKKKLNFCLFAEGNDQGPRQRRVLCRGPSHCPRQGFFFKKNFCNISLPRAMVGGPRQRLFLKKKILCRGSAWKPSAKIFQKKRIIFCRGPSYCPRQRFFGKILQISLPRAMVGGPRQRFFKKKE